MLEYKFWKYRNVATTNLAKIISFKYKKVTEILKPSNQIVVRVHACAFLIILYTSVMKTTYEQYTV